MRAHTQNQISSRGISLAQLLGIIAIVAVVAAFSGFIGVLDGSRSVKTTDHGPFIFAGPVWESETAAIVSGFRESPEGFARLVDCRMGRRWMTTLEYPGEKLALGDRVDFVVFRWDPQIAPTASAYYAKKKVAKKPE